ncbi:MAG: ubiquitin-like domain-containing protein [Candidatus Saccharimonadales bacterium]
MKRFPRSKKSKKQLNQQKLQIVVIFIVLLTALIGFILTNNNQTQQNGRLVTFHDRGQSHVILTSSTTVRSALKDAHITIDTQDIVEPAINSKLISTDSAIIIYRARPIIVVDGALRQKVMTPAQSPNEIAISAGVKQIGDQDNTIIKKANLIIDGANEVLTIERATPPPPVIPEKKPTARSLTRTKGAQIFVDSSGVAHRETYYDLPMNVVMGGCGGGDYTIRYDGAKIDKEGYVLVAAGYRAYPRCSIVETSMGPGKVYDTGGFAVRYPHGFDLATDWTNYNGR